VTTHVAESAEEFDMFMRRRGPMAEWLARNDRDMSDCGHGSPVQHLGRNGLLRKNLLAVHANYLAPGDAALFGRKGVSVVHCPRSHAYFGHQEFPREELEIQGVNICLGTDSLATVKKGRRRPLELDMFAEMQTLATTSPKLAPKTILKMATINGARALGLIGRVGELAKGRFADVIAVPFAGKAAETFEAAVHHSGGVSASMINGQWVYPT